MIPPALAPPSSSAFPRGPVRCPCPPLPLPRPWDGQHMASGRGGLSLSQDRSALLRAEKTLRAPVPGSPPPTPPSFPLYPLRRPPGCLREALRGGLQRLWVGMGWSYSKGEAGGSAEVRFPAPPPRYRWRGVVGGSVTGVGGETGLWAPENRSRTVGGGWGGAQSLWVPQYLLWLGCAVSSWALGLLDCTKSCFCQ